MPRTNNTYYLERLNCPVCKSNNITVLFEIVRSSPAFLEFLKSERFYSRHFYENVLKDLFSDSSYKIAECNNCDFIFQYEVLNDYGMKLLYNEWLDQELLLKYYSAMEPDKSQKATLGIIKKYFKNRININVLDFGAGYGNFCSISSAIGLNTFAFDLSEDKNRHLNSNLKINVISDFGQYQSFFDFIYVNQVLEHLASPADILKALSKSLKRDGIIFISAPDCSDIKSIVKNQGLSKSLFRQLSPHQHINAFNNKTLKLLCDNTGLKIIDLFDFLRFINLRLSPREAFQIVRYMKHSLLGTSLFFFKK